jgi:hypothetical protein
VGSGEAEMAEKTTDAHAGSAALKLTNKPNSEQKPAMAITEQRAGTEEINIKFPVNGKVISLDGYYKYQPAGNDSWMVMILLSKNGEIIGFGSYTASGNHAAYEPFSAQIEYDRNEIPDSASIVIYVSREEFHEGSVLVVDDFSFQYGNTGIGEKQMKNFQCVVSPNPSNGMITIAYEQLKKGNVTVSVYDMLGNEVKHIDNQNRIDAGAREFSMDCSDLKQGLYLLKLQQPGAEKTLRIAIQ